MPAMTSGRGAWPRSLSALSHCGFTLPGREPAVHRCRRSRGRTSFADRSESSPPRTLSVRSITHRVQCLSAVARPTNFSPEAKVTGETDALRLALAERVGKKGLAVDPAWRAAVEGVPRECFLGGAVFRASGSRWEPVRRAVVGEEAWLRLVYSDETWVTQVDGVHVADAEGAMVGNPTSSSTLPSLVMRMLDVAGIREGDRVLEIGSGTIRVRPHRGRRSHADRLDRESRRTVLAASGLSSAPGRVRDGPPFRVRGRASRDAAGGPVGVVSVVRWTRGVRRSVVLVGVGGAAG
ncbi:hypothetical protein ABIA38_004824 [Embleya sp. AB8]